MKLLAVLVSMFCGSVSLSAVREPVHAGSFYPSDPEALRARLESFIGSRREAGVGTEVRALVVPHAGYEYSGAVAGAGYRLLAGGRKPVNRVILLAPSHYSGFRGIMVNARDYRTPLGIYRHDGKAEATLVEGRAPVENDGVAGTREHADEVQVPFLQYVLPGARLVSVVVGDLSAGDVVSTARALASIIDDRTVVVVSSDFTHYGANYGYTPQFPAGPREGVRALDERAVTLISQGDLDGFESFLHETGDTICGRNPIRVLLALFREEGWEPRGRLLRYATSGDETGDWTNSVSYAAIALGSRLPHAGLGGEKYLSRGEEDRLLRLARYALEKHVREGASGFSDAALSRFGLKGALLRDFGVFVTLSKGGNLRGCIGSITGEEPLYRGVVHNAMMAASRDPRFPPVSAEELGDIRMEISVMSPLSRVSEPGEVKVGRDGVVLVNGDNSGVFLPQVPVEWNWDRDTYLERLGEKAGLDRGAYRRPGTILYRFTAQVFGEAERR